jgi:lysyl-tRNA synthetase class 2
MRTDRPVSPSLGRVNDTPDALPEPDLNEQMKVRRAKREQLLAEGFEPYPVTVARTHSLAEVREKWGHLETDRKSVV